MPLGITHFGGNVATSLIWLGGFHKPRRQKIGFFRPPPPPIVDKRGFSVNPPRKPRGFSADPPFTHENFQIFIAFGTQILRKKQALF